MKSSSPCGSELWGLTPTIVKDDLLYRVTAAGDQVVPESLVE